VAVQAQASVDVGTFEVRDRVRHLPFVVSVNGHLDSSGDQLPGRRYEIAAEDMRAAAFAGLERYVLEMQRVN
jgi:hypothetical protein